MTKHTHLLAALLASLPAALTAPLAAQNHPPAAPTITEPSTPNRILNPNDVHMETAPFVDPDAGDQHAATDWEIWTVTPNQRVWVAANLTGVERVHTHLGDGIFENSHGGWNRLFASTQYTLRVRHKDDSGDPATGAEIAIAWWKARGEDPRTKRIIFSDGLDVDKILDLHRQFAGRVHVSFGWGTLLTNDFRGLVPGDALAPFSLVCKAVSANGRPTVKLSDNPEKAMGPADEIERYKRVFDVGEQERIAVVV